MKKMIVTLLVFIFALFVLTGCGSYDMIDTTYFFDYAYISLPNGEVIEGEVEQWRDYQDGDQIQVKIDGVTYLTDTTRCVLLEHD